MEENKEIKEANEIYNNVTTDIHELNAAIRREQYYNDIASVKHEGYEEGEKAGIKEGIKQEKKEIAKKMLNKNLNIQEIIEITGLTKEEIEALK